MATSQNTGLGSEDPPSWYFETVSKTAESANKLFLVLLSVTLYMLITFVRLDHLDLILPSARVALPMLGASVDTFTFLIAGELILLASMLYLYLAIDRLEALVSLQRSYWEAHPFRLYPWLIATRVVQGDAEALSRFTSLLISALLFGPPLLALFALTLFSIRAHQPAFATLLVLLTGVGVALTNFFTWRSRHRANAQRTHMRRILYVTAVIGALVLLEGAALIAPVRDIGLNIWLVDRAVVPRELLSQGDTSSTILFEDDLPLQFANLWLVKLPRARLVRARLDYARLDDANLEGSYLLAAYLRYARLGGANLRGANLAYIEGQHAYFLGADLRGTNLGSARLQNANFQWANLSTANLHGAWLTGADFGFVETPGKEDERTRALIPNFIDSRANLKGASISIHTTLPDGKDLRESEFPWKERGMIVINREGNVLDPQPDQYHRKP